MRSCLRSIRLDTAVLVSSCIIFSQTVFAQNVTAPASIGAVPLAGLNASAAASTLRIDPFSPSLGMGLPALTPPVLPLQPGALNVAAKAPSARLETIVRAATLHLPDAFRAAFVPAATVKDGVLPAMQAAAAFTALPQDGKPGVDARLSAEVFDGAVEGGAAQDLGTAVSADLPSDPAPRARLSTLYPRVVFLQDVFTGPAPDAVVAYLQKIVDAGAHVVFLTWRPQKGPDSAEEILLGRMKAGRENPVIVVSYNGGKVALHGRAADPKPILPPDAPRIADLSGFSAEEDSVLHGITASLAKPLHLKEALAESRQVSDGQLLSYVVSLPASVPEEKVAPLREALLKKYNASLKAAGLPYQVAAHPSDPRAVITHSMPLRFSLPRVFQALAAQFPDEKLGEHPEKLLILTDSMNSPKFTSSFPTGSEIQVVRSGADVEQTLGAVLGDRQLDAVSLKLGKLRGYLEYWEPSHSAYRPSSGGGARVASDAEGRGQHQKFTMFVGGIIYQLMNEIYENVWRGQDRLASLAQVQARLADMWKRPLENGVPVSKSMAALLKTAGWKSNRGYLDYATSFLTNYWLREFAAYGTAARDIRDNLVSLSTDRKSLITLEFSSPSTKKLYRIHTRIPRLMRRDSDEGRILTAYAYRSGKETPDDGEEAYAEILALAILKGHGRKGADGLWHHGAADGPLLGKLRVQFEYRSSHRTWEFDPKEFLTIEEGRESQGPIVRRLTAAIERMEADSAYQKHYEEQEERATAEDLAAEQATPLPADAVEPAPDAEAK
ncbi:MAG: hypothetical protein WC969_09725 [Elusimicrobiota bacterium]|jgi:hypothetical protein